MQTYVVGFMIRAASQEVLMIRKNRPDWQAGKWNGIGGKVEPGERPCDAMVREFVEETDVGTLPWMWEHTLTMDGGNRFCIYYYRSFVDDFPPYRSVTDELVQVHSRHTILNELPVIDNMKWILPMQFTERGLVMPVYVEWR